MSIITKNGDEGWTTLFDGTKVLKSDNRPMAYGTIDELYSFLGIIKVKIKENNKEILLNIEEEFKKKSIDKTESFLKFISIFKDKDKIYFFDLIDLIQKRLISLMSELAVLKENCDKFCKNRISENDVIFLEIISYGIEKKVGKLNCFFVPGTGEIESYLNYARAIARRSEREVVFIKNLLKEDSKIIQYLNRLSDLLFLLSLFYQENN